MSDDPANPYRTSAERVGPGSDDDLNSIGVGRHQGLRQPVGQRFSLLLIAGGLAIWGGLLAIGASMGPQHHDLRRFFIVASFVAAFLACWGLLIAGRRWSWSRRYAAWSSVAIALGLGFVYLASRYQERLEAHPNLSDTPRQLFLGAAIALVVAVVLAPVVHALRRRAE